MRFNFQPSKTYANEANAEKAAQKVADFIAAEGDWARFMIVIDPKTQRYAPIFFNLSDPSYIGMIAHHGFTVVN